MHPNGVIGCISIRTTGLWWNGARSAIPIAIRWLIGELLTIRPPVSIWLNLLGENTHVRTVSACTQSGGMTLAVLSLRPESRTQLETKVPLTGLAQTSMITTIALALLKRNLSREPRCCFLPFSPQMAGLGKLSHGWNTPLRRRPERDRRQRFPPSVQGCKKGRHAGTRLTTSPAATCSIPTIVRPRSRSGRGPALAALQ